MSQRLARSELTLAVVAAVVLLASVLVIAPGQQSAEAEVATFGGGTELEVTIDSPLDGTEISTPEVDIAGTARIGIGDSQPNTSLVVVYDLSGSTLDPANGDCGGDLNGDSRSDTVLDCEIAAMEALEQTAASLGSVAEIGVVLFELGSAAADLQPVSGIQRFTEPGADLNNNSATDLSEVVRSSLWTAAFFSSNATVSLFTQLDAGTGNGGTNYSAGLATACDTIGSSSQPTRTIVFLSDGGANRGSDVTAVLPCSLSATIHSVAVGSNSTCPSDPSGLGSLQEISDLTGGTCTEVVSPADLPDVIRDLIRPEITSLALSVDGGPEVDISNSTSIPLPVQGPVSLDWSFTVEGLNGAQHEVCVVAYGGLGDELVDVTECITLIGDADGDGVPNSSDVCPSTNIAEPPPADWKKNHYWTDDDGAFLDPFGRDSGYTLIDTGGCSASQIIEAAGLGKGHSKFGITRGALNEWVSQLT